MLLRIAFRNIFKYRRRSIIILIAVTFSIFAFVFATGLIEGLKERFIRVAFENNGHILLYREGYFKKADMMPIDLMIEKPDRVIKDLSSPGIKAISQEIKTGAMVIGKNKSVDMIVRGIDTDNPVACSRYRKSVVNGRFPQKGNEVMVGRPMAKILKVSPGEQIVLMTVNAFGGINARELVISGLFETDLKEENENLVFTGIANVRSLLQIDNGATEISITLKNYELTPDFINKLSFLKRKYHLEILSWEKVFPDLYLGFSFINVLVFILFFIIIIVVSIGIVNTLLISVFERIKDIGTMRSIGTSKKQVLFIILTESGILGICGSVIGIIAGGVLITFLAKNGINIGDSAQGFAGIGKVIYPKFNLGITTYGLTLGLLVSVLGALYPGILAVKLKPIKALYHK